MNGRVYDPELGRFLSPDPIVQAPANSQSWNRYSYVLNSSLGYTDPSGFQFVEELTVTGEPYDSQQGESFDSTLYGWQEYARDNSAFGYGNYEHEYFNTDQTTEPNEANTDVPDGTEEITVTGQQTDRNVVVLLNALRDSLAQEEQRSQNGFGATVCNEVANQVLNATQNIELTSYNIGRATGRFVTGVMLLTLFGSGSTTVRSKTSTPSGSL